MRESSRIVSPPASPVNRPMPKPYAAPALDKGLDIIELLASQTVEMSQNEIARRLDRTVNEIFRMLMTLERRGFIVRDAATDGYRLGMKTFQLAHRHPPTEQLLQVALPVMRGFADRVGQSVHLAVRSEDRVLIVAQVPAPTAIGLTVRLGAEFPIVGTTSGQVLLAFEPSDPRDALIARLRASDASSASGWRLTETDFSAIRAQGRLVEASSGVQAVVNASYPILTIQGDAVAALTMPYLHQSPNATDFSDAACQLGEAAAAISRELGGSGRLGSQAAVKSEQGTLPGGARARRNKCGGTEAEDT